MWAITSTFWAVYFTTSRLYLHLNCFLNSFPSFTSSPDASYSDLYMKGKIFKIKNAMVKFISIEYSKPKILTWNLHHHSPSYIYLAVLFCLREALVSSPYTSPRPSSEFCRTIQFSNCLVVYHYHDFSPKQLRLSEPFLNISVFLM